MKRLLSTLVVPAALALGSLTTAVVTVGPASAAPRPHTMMHGRTWHGTVGIVGAMLGSNESFTFKVGTKTYKVDWNDMTHFAMGTPKKIKAGAAITVTGTLSKSTIHATKLAVH